MKEREYQDFIWNSVPNWDLSPHLQLPKQELKQIRPFLNPLPHRRPRPMPRLRLHPQQNRPLRNPLHSRRHLPRMHRIHSRIRIPSHKQHRRIFHPRLHGFHIMIRRISIEPLELLRILRAPTPKPKAGYLDLYQDSVLEYSLSHGCEMGTDRSENGRGSTCRSCRRKKAAKRNPRRTATKDGSVVRPALALSRSRLTFVAGANGSGKSTLTRWGSDACAEDGG